MKRIFFIVLLVIVPALCFAASKKDSGNKELNRYLEEISYDVHEGRLSNAALKSHIQESFAVKKKDYMVMSRRKLDPGEKYLVGLIYKATKEPVAKIVRRHRRGRAAWSDVIYYSGTTPDEINVLRRADEKGWRKARRKAHKLDKVRAKQTTVAQATKMTMNNKGEQWECQCRPKRK